MFSVTVAVTQSALFARERRPGRRRPWPTVAAALRVRVGRAPAEPLAADSAQKTYKLDPQWHTHEALYTINRDLINGSAARYTLIQERRQTCTSNQTAQHVEKGEISVFTVWPEDVCRLQLRKQ
jgi:hypothetical protein